MLLIAVLAILGVAAPASPRPDTSSGDHRVYVANVHCTGHTLRPERITLACRYSNLYATEGHFFSGGVQVYGTEEAAASATIHENACRPDCAAGHFLVDKGALILKRIERCKDGLLYYSRAEYAFPAGQGEVDIQPRERCSVVRPTHRVS